MYSLLSDFVTYFPWERAIEIIVDLAIKATVVCLAAWMATALMRRSSAYVRSIVWVFTFLMLLSLPFTQAATPVWRLPILPTVASWWSDSGTETGIYPPLAEKADPGVAGGSEGSTEAGTQPATSGFARDWQTWIILVWAAGAILSLTWLVVRSIVGSRILGQAEAAGTSWMTLMNELSGEYEIRKRVRLFESETIKAAVTIGALNPAIVVPAESANWPDERCRFMLSHELAHVKRRDSLIEIVALLVKSIYWFNPLVWLAVGRLRIERERDCDDVVLNTGARPSDYAMLLMDLATEIGTPPHPVWQLSTISQGSNLKDRIMCILDSKINRKRAKRRGLLVSCILLALVIFPLSTSGLWESRADEQKPKKKKEKIDLEKKKALEDLKKKQMQLEKKMSGEKISKEEKTKLTWKKISENENSAAVIVAKMLKKHGPGAGIKVFEKIKKSGSNEYYFKENEFNTLGYLFLYHEQVKEAVEVFKINVEEYPDSWNVYDSLGEAYMVAGKLDKARKLYKKSMALNPENENGEKMLVKLAELEKKGEKIASE